MVLNGILSQGRKPADLHSLQSTRPYGARHHARRIELIAIAFPLVPKLERLGDRGDAQQLTVHVLRLIRVIITQSRCLGTHLSAKLCLAIRRARSRASQTAALPSWSLLTRTNSSDPGCCRGFCGNSGCHM